MIAALWPLVWHYGLGVSLAAAGVAFLALTTFKRTGLALAAVAAGFLLGQTWGFTDGKALIQDRWDRAERAMVVKGSKARDEAEAFVPPAEADVEDEHPLIGKPPTCISFDKFDRDCAK